MNPAPLSHLIGEDGEVVCELVLEEPQEDGRLHAHLRQVHQDVADEVGTDRRRVLLTPRRHAHR